MASTINHVAIASSNFALELMFYENMFGMMGSTKGRARRGLAVGDGNVGLNVNPRRAGRAGALDHFGIQVDDLEETMARIQEKYPQIDVLQRPARRVFAAFSTHDPDGNVFDLTQKSGANLKNLYTQNDWRADRTVSHLGIRTMNAEACAAFYVETVGLQPANLPIDNAHGVTDGRVTLIFMPWKIKDYADCGISKAGMDYIGFKVEDMAKFKAHVQAISEHNPLLAPAPVGSGAEGKARLEMFKRTSLGSWHIADPDGVLLDIVA